MSSLAMLSMRVRKSRSHPKKIQVARFAYLSVPPGSSQDAIVMDMGGSQCSGGRGLHGIQPPERARPGDHH